MAGRAARCPCGAEIRCPEQPEAEDGGYELAPEPVRAARVERPVVAPAAGPVAAAAPMLGYQTPRKALPKDQRVEADVETLKNQTIPIWLLGGGVVVELIASFIESRHDLKAAVIHISFELVVGTVLMLAGVLIAARARGIQIGSFWTAALRVAAISVAPAAVGDLIMPIAWMIPFGGLLQLGVQFVLYFALLGVLFDLDESDTWYCVTIIFLVNLGVYFLLLFRPWMK
jgi:hypothetical protein